MKVKTWDPLAYRAQQIRGHCADTARHQMRGMAEFSVRSIDSCGIANLYSSYRCNIDHGHVHRDNSHHRLQHTANQYLAAVAQPPVNAVSISCCKDGDARRLPGHKTCAITDSRSRRHITQTNNPRA